MKGIQYLIDEQGKQTSVLIDLEQWGELWQDFYDVMVAQERATEDEVDWADLKGEMEEDISVE